MKSENIPADIRTKSIKEAQNEIKEIIKKLENTETNLEDSIEQYNRMMQLNYHIQDQFKQKSKEIKQSTLHKNKKNLLKNSK
jgi:exodeoxyribonuclease VII small subunit